MRPGADDQIAKQAQGVINPNSFGKPQMGTKIVKWVYSP